jgi:hypothetical protein
LRQHPHCSCKTSCLAGSQSVPAFSGLAWTSKLIAAETTRLVRVRCRLKKLLDWRWPGRIKLYQDNMPRNLKAYPDQPVLKEEAKEDGMVAFREEKIALIPGQAGQEILWGYISWCRKLRCRY